VAAAADALRSGLHILIFAEGTRSKDGRLAGFKRGPFYLAKETGAPIVPVAISGTQRLMRKGSIAISPGAVKVEMLAAIDPAGFGTREELMAAVRAAIAGALPDEMRPKDSGE
jgi:1-acyl-sn-glycerol-3-phosphate acyltransferase